MHALDMILNFFREGGIFLYPLALIWVIGLVIALVPLAQLRRDEHAVGGADGRPGAQLAR